MRILLIFLTSTVVFLSTLNTSAYGCQNWKKLSTDDIMLAMGVKIVRGVTNVATGWMELPRSIYVTSRDKGIVQGIIAGPFQGILSASFRTIIGAAEVVTFVVPAPHCYSPYLDRPLVWSNLDQRKGVLIFNKCPKNKQCLTPCSSKKP